MSKRKKISPSKVPEYFKALLAKAGVTETHADFRKVLQAFRTYCETPIECSHEMLMFAADDTHVLDWWKKPHYFRVILERGFYEQESEDVSTCHTSNIEIHFRSSAASRKINASCDLEATPEGGYDGAQFNEFFSKIEKNGPLWKLLATAPVQAVSIYAGPR